jgi:hypothetical protein
MEKWLRNYEYQRHSRKNPKEPNESWQSSKYDFTDPNVRLEYVPEMGCSVGGCISSLKRSWRVFEIAGRNGEPRGDLAWRINHVQDTLGIPLTEFEEYPGIYQSQEEILKKEEVVVPENGTLVLCLNPILMNGLRKKNRHIGKKKPRRKTMIGGSVN